VLVERVQEDPNSGPNIRSRLPFIPHPANPVLPSKIQNQTSTILPSHFLLQTSAFILSRPAGAAQRVGGPPIIQKFIKIKLKN
jgi:hypothetical protein